MAQANAEPVLTISYIKEEEFKTTLKCAEGVCLPDPNWKMVPQQRSLITEALLLILLVQTLGTTSRPGF